MIDFLAELDAIRERAAEAQRKLAEGRAVNGRSDLQKIEKMAEDAIRHGRSEQDRDDRFEHA